MKVFFLGTGAAEGFPALFSGTPINQEARRRGGKNLRLRSGILIDRVVRVDLCPDTLAQVHKFPQVDLSNLEQLVFTHTHDDHFAVRELQYLSPSFAPDRRGVVSVFASEDALGKLLPALENFFEPPPLEFHSLQPFQPTQIGSLKVTPIIANHKPDELCFNYIFDDGKARLLYASDTGWYSDETWKFLDGFRLDACIVECGKGISDNGYPGHLNFNECIDYREKLLAGGGITTETPFYLTHISHTGGLLHEEMEELSTRHGMHVAYDGLELDL